MVHKKLLIAIVLTLICNTASSQWQSAGAWNSFGAQVTIIYDMKIEGSKIYAGGRAWSGLEGRVYFSDSLHTFQNITPPPPGFNDCNSVAYLNGIVYAYGTPGLIMSTNNGINWLILGPVDNENTDGTFSSPKLFTNENKLYCHTSNGLKVSADSGVTWSYLTNGVVGTYYPAVFYVSDSLFLGYSRTMGGRYIYKSTNEGQTWVPTPYTLPIASNDFIGPAYFYKDKIYITTEPSGSPLRAPIYVSTNGGANFNFYSSVSSRGGVFCIYGYENYLFLGTDSTIYYSYDDGSSWINIGDNLQLSNDEYGITQVGVLNNYVIACHTYRGINKRPLTDLVTIQNQIAELPSDYNLYQNYPNPFNPSTNITFELKQKAYVELNVYDITGRLISQLVKGEKQGNLYEISFKGESLNSGIYFYSLIVDGTVVDSKKMLLIK